MKAKEKAKELVYKFYNIDSDSEIYDDFTMKIFYAQRCALISVDEILEFHDRIDVKYWKEVKQEINKINR